MPNLIEHAKDFEHPDTGLVVRVNRAPGLRPRYSYEVGRKNHNDQFVRFFPFAVDVDSAATVSCAPFPFDALKGLIEEARIWMRDQYQLHEYEILADKQRREQAALNRDKPKVRPGLKAIAKHDREAYEARERAKTPRG